MIYIVYILSPYTCTCTEYNLDICFTVIIDIIRNLISTVYGHYVGSNCYCGNYNILIEADSIS